MAPSLQQFLAHKKLGYAEFDPQLPHFLAAELIDSVSRLFCESDKTYLFGKSWNIYIHSSEKHMLRQWDRLFEIMTVSHCSSLDFNMTDEKPQMLKAISVKVSFPQLVSISISWTQLKSIEPLVSIDAPNLRYFSIQGCPHISSIKSLKKLISPNLKTISIWDNKNWNSLQTSSRINFSVGDCWYMGLYSYFNKSITDLPFNDFKFFFKLKNWNPQKSLFDIDEVHFCLERYQLTINNQEREPLQREEQQLYNPLRILHTAIQNDQVIYQQEQAERIEEEEIVWQQQRFEQERTNLQNSIEKSFQIWRVQFKRFKQMFKGQSSNKKKRMIQRLEQR